MGVCLATSAVAKIWKLVTWKGLMDSRWVSRLGATVEAPLQSAEARLPVLRRAQLREAAAAWTVPMPRMVSQVVGRGPNLTPTTTKAAPEMIYRTVGRTAKTAQAGGVRLASLERCPRVAKTRARPAALHGGAWLAGGATSASSLTWQHARFATHTLQLSVRAGLSIPLVRTILAKVRLVSELCRKSTNFQREMSVAVDVKEAGAALRDGRERIPAANLVSRLIVDCPTRWESTLAMVRRFLRVGPAVPSALSAYYQ